MGALKSRFFLVAACYSHFKILIFLDVCLVEAEAITSLKQANTGVCSATVMREKHKTRKKKKRKTQVRVVLNHITAEHNNILIWIKVKNADSMKRLSVSTLC